MLVLKDVSCVRIKGTVHPKITIPSILWFNRLLALISFQTHTLAYVEHTCIACFKREASSTINLSQMADTLLRIIIEDCVFCGTEVPHKL